MKPLRLTLLMLTAATALAACGQKAETKAAQTPPSTPAESAPQAGSDTAMNGMPAGLTTSAKGAGVVTAVDAAAGTITIDHGPIPEANWPPMTMAFKATPEQVSSVKVGDKVTFELKLTGGAGEIMAIRKP